MKSFFAFLSLLLLAACAQPSVNNYPLQLEEHPLVAPPNPDSFSFQPVQGTQASVLDTHAGERGLRFADPYTTVEGNPAITSLGEGDDLVAVMTTAAEGDPEQNVKLYRDDHVIFETPAGMPSPALPLQGLWTYDDHWALEILYSDPDTWAGEVFIDGELVNTLKGYDEAFGLQLLSGKLFFFFSRDGKLGYSYDGQEFNLSYDEIPHYRCCSESTLNPIQAQSMVAFFTRQDQNWFYVEMGDFGK